NQNQCIGRSEPQRLASAAGRYGAKPCPWVPFRGNRSSRLRSGRWRTVDAEVLSRQGPGRGDGLLNANSEGVQVIVAGAANDAGVCRALLVKSSEVPAVEGQDGPMIRGCVGENLRITAARAARCTVTTSCPSWRKRSTTPKWKSSSA